MTAPDQTLFEDLNCQGFVDSSNHPEIPDSSPIEIPARDIRAGDTLVFGAKEIPVTAVASKWRNPLSQTGTNVFTTGSRSFLNGEVEGWAAALDRLLPVRKGPQNV